MNRIALPLLAGLALAGCGPSPFPDASFDGSIEDRSRFIANALQYMLPQTDDGMTIVVARAEGRELVLEVELSLSGYATITDSALTKSLRPGLCSEGYRGFIEAGGVVRFDFRDPQTGKTAGPGRVASCHGV
ncbi:MAG: hypothetical protein NWS68_00295 [Erythrobacter sp.]|nr:hypothetical protein [Erythrobacter sp.]